MQIDDCLGIKGGLLQRCCFFGQHALQLLLGLTDSKLKQELSALVDTSLWIAATKDARARENSAQSQLKGLNAQCKLLRTDLGRADTARASASAKLHSLEQELALATEALTAIPVSAFSIADLNSNLAAVQNEQVLFSENTHKPLYAAAVAVQRQCDTVCAKIDTRLVQVRIEAAKLETEMATTNRTVEGLKNRRARLQADDDTFHREFDALQLKTDAILQSSAPPFTIDGADTSALRQRYEQLAHERSSVNIKTADVETALMRLRELQTAHPCAKDAACPTCGQEMPLESRVERTAQLTASLGELRKERKSLSERSSCLDNLSHYFTSMEAIKGKRSNLHKQTEEASFEMEAHEVALSGLSDRLEALQRERAQAELEKVTLLEGFAQQLKENKEALGVAENHLAVLRAKECGLQEDIEASRQQPEKRQVALNSVAIAQERVSNAHCVLLEKVGEQARIQKELSTIDALSEQLTAERVILKRLALVLGQRGIQNYVFQNVIKQLESITNTYLSVLTAEGIQLTLEGVGEEESRIVKSVWVRSKESDGEYRERSLAQLSGGQWRRVSLAFDFAFAELIRRRGMLRSNLMAMDEVLTHLDASGREAVGTVLRAMVQAPSARDEMDTQEVGAHRVEGADVFDGGGDQSDAVPPSSEEQRMQRLSSALLGGGAYETVLVILQDLAAAELSEAFDHVDVVVKESDKSTVRLDGEEI